ncbi:MAG: hypothetical protein M3357_19110 [Actinomycetota bacterium]|nr:hypothetical protein [Actinomycetota bacterium]
MKLFKPTRMAIFGLGFLAGSRAGRGAWDAVENKVSQLQNRTGGGTNYGNGTRSMNSPEGGTVKEGTLTEF